MDGSIQAYFEYKKIFIEAKVNITFSESDTFSDKSTNVKVKLVDVDIFVLMNFPPRFLQTSFYQSNQLQ